MPASVLPVDDMLPPPKLAAQRLQHVMVMYADAVAPLVPGAASHLPKNQIALLNNADLFAGGAGRGRGDEGRTTPGRKGRGKRARIDASS